MTFSSRSSKNVLDIMEKSKSNSKVYGSLAEDQQNKVIRDRVMRADTYKSIIQGQKTLRPEDRMKIEEEDETLKTDNSISYESVLFKEAPE